MKDALTIYTSATHRRYVDVADLAKICGLSAYDLDRKYRPEHWASPRDFRWDGHRAWFAVLSLQQLIDGLLAAGETDAAQKLRERMLPWIEAAVAENFDAGMASAPQPASDRADRRSTAGQRQPRGESASKNATAVASTSQGQAACVETIPERRSWAAEWEAAHQ